MESFESLPAGYISKNLSKIDFKSLPLDSELAHFESCHLIKNFAKQERKIGLCIEEVSRDSLMRYIAVGNKLQQKNKKVRFYPCVSNEEDLILLLNAFSFFIPNPSVWKRFFSILPNCFYSHLSDKERVVADLNILENLDRILISDSHPYRDLVEEDKIIKDALSENCFVFNLKEEEAL